jgi:hypothetical protein
MRTSGWCQAPTGFRPKHEHCKAAICGCNCHNKNGDKS